MKDGKDVNTQTVLDVRTTLSGEVLELLLSSKDVPRYLLEADCCLHLGSSFLAEEHTQQQQYITVNLKKTDSRHVDLLESQQLREKSCLVVSSEKLLTCF